MRGYKTLERSSPAVMWAPEEGGRGDTFAYPPISDSRNPAPAYRTCTVVETVPPFTVE